MKLLILSDLHNEFEPMPPPTEALALADVVVLAGDIHTKQRSLDWIRALVNDPAKPVVYVAGNHEFYQGHFDRTLAKLHERAAGTSIHVLENEVWSFGSVRFLGCTLWTDFNLNDPRHAHDRAQTARLCMNDFRTIRAAQTYRKLSPVDTLGRHAQSRAWLRQQLSTPFSGATVVVTHHAPSLRSLDPEFALDPLAAAYASDLEDVMGLGVTLWVHGHLHTSLDYEVASAQHSTRVVCNPRGYAPRHLNPSFDPGLLIEV